MAIYRLWPSTSGPASSNVDNQPYTLGVEFYATAAANATAVYFWRPGTSGAITFDVGIYRVDSASAGTLLGSVLAVSSSANQGAWHRVQLPSPIALTANQRYRAVIKSMDADMYSSTGAYWSSGAGSAGLTNGILVAPNGTNATGGDQGSFINLNNIGSTVLNFPVDSFNSANYWVDVEVDDGSVSGSLAASTPALTVGPPTVSLSGAVSGPAYAGDVAASAPTITAGPPIMAASGTVTPPVYAGAIAASPPTVTVGPAELAMSGTVTVPVYSGTLIAATPTVTVGPPTALILDEALPQLVAPAGRTLVVPAESRRLTIAATSRTVTAEPEE